MTRVIVWLLKRMGYTLIMLGRAGKPKPGACPRCHDFHDLEPHPDFGIAEAPMEFDDDL